MQLQNVAELQNATRRFGHVVAVADLSLDLRAGEILGLYGPSGSGKTTTIRLILGVYLPTAGSVRILGVPSNRLGARERQQIGYAAQRYLYPPTLTAYETVAYAAGLYGMGLFRGPRAIRHVLNKVDLWDKRRRSVDDMSGGERRRITNAAALVHGPRLIFLDEPTSGLDPLLRTQTWEWFRELRSEGRTLLVSGHYLEEAEQCDRLALVVGGKVVALGTPGELRHQALGGEIVQVEVEGPLAAAVDALRDISHQVSKIQVHAAQELWVTVPDAGTALPILLERLQGKGVVVRSAGEVRPPFDEIFGTLVQSGD